MTAKRRVTRGGNLRTTFGGQGEANGGDKAGAKRKTGGEVIRGTESGDKVRAKREAKEDVAN